MSRPYPIHSASGDSRRTFLKFASAAVAVPFIGRPLGSLASDDEGEEVIPVIPPSPPTIPWTLELPERITPLAPVLLSPAPTEQANGSAGEAGRAAHQRWAELAYGTTYELTARENPQWLFNEAYPRQPIWGFQGNEAEAMTPGPVIFARYGEPIVVRIRNGLPADHQGFGSPEIATHLHNAHTGSESDGFPGDFYSATKAGPTLAAPGEFLDHLYGNIYAGFDEFQNGVGDPREALGTLFYHDHTMDFTAPNIYKGLLGFYLLFDDLDSGDEHDPNPGALRLPSHPHDYPLAFGDKRFAPDGTLFWDQVSPEGVLGDKITVNGIIEPVLRVAARKYRLRLLNTGPSRFYEFYLVDRRGRDQRFTYIANDGNLLPAPLRDQTRVRLAVAERGDIVVDFSAYPLGTELYLVNRLTHKAEDTRQPKDVRRPGVQVLKFIVDRMPLEADISQVPDSLRELRPVTADEIAAAPLRRWVFDRDKGLWSINERFFDPNQINARIRQGSAEIWEFINPEDGWDHPIHVHFEEGRIISKTVLGRAVPIPLHEQGRKDVYVIGEDMTVRVFLRFRDFLGKYALHCHNLIHEDHAMMARWDIELDTSGPSPSGSGMARNESPLPGGRT
ncbi:bilirubin oxidase [Pseudomonas taiwanensis]|uniref:multicopper oxidase family protein n=1 Tax=Pseudomonas taiwanensis TaxID=470150 RepID=UPI0015BB29E9|nr:multicopper oxidase domain-containing protein [Pseudomonas taiwanensis]NWL77451.1 bilirubin oxidase [Pseudomonas taiwanensis]